MGLIGTVTTSRVPITSAPPKTWAAAAMGLIVTALGIGVAGAEALAGAGPPVGAVGVIVGGTGGMLADAVVASRVGLGRVALGDAVTSGGVLSGRAVVRVAARRTGIPPGATDRVADGGAGLTRCERAVRVRGDPNGTRIASQCAGFREFWRSLGGGDRPDRKRIH